MSHEILDHRTTYFPEREDNFSTIKHEFSKIFHENNLHSFTNPSDIGFIDMSKATTQPYSRDYDEAAAHAEADGHEHLQYHAQDGAHFVNGVVYHDNYSQGRYMQTNAIQTSAYGNYSDMVQKPLYDQGQQYQQYPYKYGEYGYMDYSSMQNAAYAPQSVYDIYNAPEIIDTHANNSLGMMWSNEANKELNKGANSNLQISDKRFAVADEANEYHNENTRGSYTVEQSFENVSNKTLGLQLSRATKTAQEGDSILRRTSRVSKPSALAAERDDDFSGSDDEKDEGFGGPRSRSSRGLRVLSLQVRDIVEKKKKTSYKEVADALLIDLHQKLKGRPQSEIAKEEQNVKRRVYDALNVLIAAGILRKDGKTVSMEHNAKSSGNKKRTAGADRETLMDKIEDVKNRKREKAEQLQELVFKHLAIKNLVRKNMAKEENMNMKNGMNKMSVKGPSAVKATRIDVVEDNATLQQKSQDMIKFPFIVLSNPSADNNLNLNMDASQRQLSVESSKPINIFGDIDILLKMKLHFVPRGIFEKDTPKELRRFVSQSFVNSLM